MPFNAQGVWVPEEDSVSTKLNQIMGQDSPLMDQARTQGLKLANRRGLLNSSIATGAGVNEMLKAAVPVASQEAQQLHQKNLAQMDIGSREKVALANVAAHDRQTAGAALADAQKVYGALFTDLQKNNDLSADARNRYYQHASALRDTSFDLIQQIWGIDLDWAPAVATS